VGFVSRKVRTAEEIQIILRAFANGSSIPEISEKFGISESSFYRILRVSRGEEAYASPRKDAKRIETLEKKLKERDREIALMREALKKN